MVNENTLKDFLYTVRGLKRELYAHRPTQLAEDKVLILHRCKVCGHTAVGEADIPHHPNCALERLQRAWHVLKLEDASLFDFKDRFPNKQENTVDHSVTKSQPPE